MYNYVEFWKILLIELIRSTCVIQQKQNWEKVSTFLHFLPLVQSLYGLNPEILILVAASRFLIQPIAFQNNPSTKSFCVFIAMLFCIV